MEGTVMNGPQQNLISRVAQQARKAKDLMSLTEEIDTLYEGTPNYKAQCRQVDIDTVPSFAAAGLTEAQLDAAVYILKMVNVQLKTIDFPALVMLANL
jgi:hypothetical protein